MFSIKTNSVQVAEIPHDVHFGYLSHIFDDKDNISRVRFTFGITYYFNNEISFTKSYFVKLEINDEIKSFAGKFCFYADNHFWEDIPHSISTKKAIIVCIAIHPITGEICLSAKDANDKNIYLQFRKNVCVGDICTYDDDKIIMITDSPLQKIFFNQKNYQIIIDNDTFEMTKRQFDTIKLKLTGDACYSFLKTTKDGIYFFAKKEIDIHSENLKINKRMCGVILPESFSNKDDITTVTFIPFNGTAIYHCIYNKQIIKIPEVSIDTISKYWFEAEYDEKTGNNIILNGHSRPKKNQNWAEREIQLYFVKQSVNLSTKKRMVTFRDTEKDNVVSVTYEFCCDKIMSDEDIGSKFLVKIKGIGTAFILRKINNV